MTALDFWPVFRREMAMLVHRIGGLGYLFSVLRMSPVSDASIVFGIALAGAVRAILAGAAVFLAAWLFFDIRLLAVPGFVGLVLTAFCFAEFGVAVGLSIRGQEQFSVIINFFITPMTFFCGSFFPIANLPEIVQRLVSLLPLAHTNALLQADGWDGGALSSFVVLAILTALAFGWGVWRMKRYQEF